MSIGDKKLDDLLEKLAPVFLPPAEYPPADVVRDTPHEEIIERIKENAKDSNLVLDQEYWDVTNFLFEFYRHCCEPR